MAQKREYSLENSECVIPVSLSMNMLLSFLLLSAHSVNSAAQGSFAGSHLSKFIGISDGLPSNFVDDIMFDDAG